MAGSCTPVILDARESRLPRQQSNGPLELTLLALNLRVYGAAGKAWKFTNPSLALGSQRSSLTKSHQTNLSFSSFFAGSPSLFEPEPKDNVSLSPVHWMYLFHFSLRPTRGSPLRHIGGETAAHEAQP